MKTRNCPFCGESISNEAIICKYCHKLLIDEQGNNIDEVGSDEVQAAEEDIAAADDMLEGMDSEQAFENVERMLSTSEFDLKFEKDEPEEEKTVVFSTKDLEKGFADYDDEDDVPQIDENVFDEYKQDSNSYDDEDDGDFDDEDLYEDYETVSDSDSKRTFMITAIITLGILIIIIAAVAVGYKLFGFGDSSSEDSSTVPVPEAVTTTKDTASDSVTESVIEYVPAVTDDTVSEAPEEVYDSSLTDTVSDTDSAEDSTADSSTDTSSTDSESSSSADSTSTASVSDTTSRTPAGSYFSWDEVMDIMDDYVAEHGGSYSYAYGTDGVEMVFYYTDTNGNSSTVRVDLPTGAISIIG